MNKQTLFINDLRSVFLEHGVYLDAAVEYDGHDNQCGISCEIKSHEYEDNKLVIFIEDALQLAELLK